MGLQKIIFENIDSTLKRGGEFYILNFGIPSGIISIENKRIDNFYVVGMYQKNGLGTMLFKVSQLRKPGEKYAYLECSFTSSSMASLRYEHPRHAFPHPANKAMNVVFWDGHVENRPFQFPYFSVNAITKNDKNVERSIVSVRWYEPLK